LPTDALYVFSNTVHEILDYGKDKSYSQTIELGSKIRKLLKDKGFDSVADEGFESPTVVVS